MKIRPIILSGGAGTRLWPVSRQNLPKQFVPLLEGNNLFYNTLKSVSDPKLFLPPIIVGNKDHKYLILDTLTELGIKNATVILEPLARNTAAAIVMAAAADYKINPHILHLVRPSDHVISDKKGFQKAIQSSVASANQGSLVLFGVKPLTAETGYGYIVPARQSKQRMRPIVAFKEKPPRSTAKALIKKGALWNSGIFFYKVETLVKEVTRLAEPLWAQCQEALKNSQKESFGYTLPLKSYSKMQNEPFDRVIMEKTKLGAVLKCNFGWSDVGSWQSLWTISKKDKNGNIAIGPAVLESASNCYIRSDGPTVAAMELKDTAVIATKDAVLVAPLAYAQDIKKLVASVENQLPPLTQDPPVARRDWGTYENLVGSKQFQVRHVMVLPGRSMAIQKHKYRSEHWVVVSGKAKVLADNKVKFVSTHQSIYVPKGSKHQLSNPGKEPLHIIEVQSGEYLSEDDVVRFETKSVRHK